VPRKIAARSLGLRSAVSIFAASTTSPYDADSVHTGQSEPNISRLGPNATRTVS
jgi:hypothetical protein